MKWQINYSRSAHKFMEQQNIPGEVREILTKLLMKIEGKTINIDLKKLEGDWDGYYRIRKHNIRIIFQLHKTEKIVFVEKIDFRGSVYK